MLDVYVSGNSLASSVLKQLYQSNGYLEILKGGSHIVKMKLSKIFKQQSSLYYFSIPYELFLIALLLGNYAVFADGCKTSNRSAFKIFRSSTSVSITTFFVWSKYSSTVSLPPFGFASPQLLVKARRDV